MSRFMTDADYKPYITDARLTKLIGPDDTQILLVEGVAVQAVTDALFERYDVGTIFSQSGSNRNATIILWVRTIVMYFLWERIDDKLIPERIQKNYDYTREQLIDIQKGLYNVQLPRIADKDNNGYVKTKTRWGSDTKNGQDYYVKGQPQPFTDSNLL